MFDSYIICGTPRSGSTLLCGLLAATGTAGAPDSFFARPFLSAWAAEWGLPPAATLSQADYEAVYLRAALAAGRGGTPLFGLRLMMESLADLSAMLDRTHPGSTSDRARLEAAFGKVLYIHLSRRDLLAQAVSRVKAEQTGLWHIAPDGSEVERLAPPQAPRYDYARIRRHLAQLKADDAAWIVWFKRHGIGPLQVAYEDLSGDPHAVLVRICGALGQAPPHRDAVIPDVAKLADATNLDWMRRYRRDARSAP